MHGEIRAASEAAANAALRRQGILITKLKKQKSGSGGKVSEKDITLFSRQLATMVKSGVPLLQSFDIVGKGTNNPALARLLFAIKSDVETGANLASAFRKYPQYFDALFCNLVEAGEQAGILDTLLDRLATYKEKIQAIKSKIKSALTDRHPYHRLYHHCGNHDFCGACVQERVCQFRRRASCPNSNRDRHF